jgi:hypothetical protein
MKRHIEPFFRWTGIGYHYLFAASSTPMPLLLGWKK